MHRILTKKRRKSNGEKGRKSGREEAKPKETSSKTKQNKTTMRKRQTV